jgi:ribosomal protein L37AE/L43A
MHQTTKEANRPKRTRSRRNKPAKAPKSPRSFSSVTKKPKSSLTGSRRGVLFCPKCGSTNLFWASGLPHLWSIWECRNCGYRGAFIVRDGGLAEKVRENYSKKTVKH